MALNLEHLQRLTARIDFNALATQLSDVSSKIVGMEDSTIGVITAALDTESETDVVKAENLKDYLSRSGLESVVNSVVAGLDALSVAADDLQAITGGGGPQQMD